MDEAGVQQTLQSSLASGIRQVGRENTLVRGSAQHTVKGYYWELVGSRVNSISITSSKSYLELIFVGIYNP